MLKSQVTCHFMCDKVFSKELLGKKKSNKANVITTRKIPWGQTKTERILPGSAKWI